MGNLLSNTLACLCFGGGALFQASTAHASEGSLTNCVIYDFSSTSGLNLVGSAFVTNGILRLTPATHSQIGNAWLQQKQPVASGFDTSFHFQITDLGNIYGNEPGGDLITFSVQNVGPTANDWGVNLTNGYVSVCFNTFWNWPGCRDYSVCDLSGNSVGIFTNEFYMTQVDLNPLGINMSDGAVHLARIAYQNGGLNVWVDGVAVLTSVPVDNLRPGTDQSGDAWVGFSSLNGAAYENHDILDWSFCTGPTTLGIPPVIVSQPLNQSVGVGSNVVFTVTAEGTPPLGYQWQLNGTIISEATDASLALNNVQVTDAGSYSVRVTNLYGSVLSSNATLSVIPPTTVTNCVTYAGFTSTSGLNLIGSADVTNGVLRLTPAVDSQVGNAWLQQKQPVASGFDTSFRFQITDPGNIFGNEPGGDGITFSIQNIGSAERVWGANKPEGYLSVCFNTFWNWPGCTDYSISDLSGNSIGISTNEYYMTQVDLNPLGINLSDGAVHSARIVYQDGALTVWVDGLAVLSNVPLDSLRSGTDASGEAWVGFTALNGAAYENHDILDWFFCTGTVSPGFPPVIVSQPMSRTVALGSNATFSVTAEGTLPLSFQWQHNGTNVTEGTDSSLALSNVQMPDAGSYSVWVTNLYGSVLSSNATLTVISPEPVTNCVNYADFASTSGLNLVGTASATNGVLRLTPAMYSQIGTAWLQQKKPVAAGFDTTFRFQITDLGNIYGNEPGGDGFTFSIQDISPTEAVWGINQSNHYVSVCFNTFWNWPGCRDYSICDLSGNSVGIFTNEYYMTQVDLNPLGINMSDGAVHQARIAYQDGALTVWVDGVALLTNVPVDGLRPGTDASGEAWVGFSSLNGAAYENHDILDWSFCTRAVPRVNTAPIADPGATLPLVISINSTNAKVVLDGSRSYDADNDPLQYDWFLAGASVPIASGVAAVVDLPLGINALVLTVNDGFTSTSQSFTVEVITITEAVERLAALVESGAPNPRPLIAILSAALASIDRSNPVAAINQLQAFQNQVRARVLPLDSEMAATFIQTAQDIIDALPAASTAHPRITNVSRLINGRIRLGGEAPPSAQLIVEASTNLVDWVKIGVTTMDNTGVFKFEDPDASPLSFRFYRLVSP